jgi:hypothetical protein
MCHQTPLAAWTLPSTDPAVVVMPKTSPALESYDQVWPWPTKSPSSLVIDSEPSSTGAALASGA